MVWVVSDTLSYAVCLLSLHEIPVDYLGLECHDVGEGGALLFAFKDKPPSWSHAYFYMLQDTSMRSSASLAPNMVITVEPGMYASSLSRYIRAILTNPVTFRVMRSRKYF
jgi:hypothetical protein